MTGAMYAAIGGLKSHMSKLNVIGNNIANVNTVGYKAGRMTFQESMYTTSRAGSNGGATAGGNNPSQVGYGCSVGSIDLNMSPSTYAPTGIGLDCMIEGEGFFLVGDKDGNILSNDDVTSLQLTRVGNFWQDPDGYICDRYGNVVYGFATVQNPLYEPGLTQPKKGVATTDWPGVEATESEEDFEARMEQYSLRTKKTTISTQLVPLRVPLSAAAPTEANGGIVKSTITDDDENAGDDAEPTVVTTQYWDTGDPVYPYMTPSNAEGKQYYVNNYVKPGKDSVYTPAADDTPATLTGALGYGKTMIPAAQNTDPNSVSGTMICQLKEMSIGKDGSIIGIASNGDTVVVGYIAIANVDSPDGVSHVDGPYYKAMGGAGCVRVSALGGILEGKYLSNQEIKEAEGEDDGYTPNPADAIVNEKSVSIRNGGLEASSTDIATEFSEMITTQRGYQANTRIITVTDSMLEELVNMKR